MAGNRTKLQRRQETHSPEAGLGLPICSASSFFVSPCTNRLNTWIMPSSGLEYTYITYPLLTNQLDTFLCWEMVPKQTLSVHLISRFVGSGWQSCYILFNNREQQPWLDRAYGREQLTPMHIHFFNDISFLWLFLGSSHSVSIVMRCGIVETARGNLDSSSQVPLQKNHSFLSACFPFLSLVSKRSILENFLRGPLTLMVEDETTTCILES